MYKKVGLPVFLLTLLISIYTHYSTTADGALLKNIETHKISTDFISSVLSTKSSEVIRQLDITDSEQEGGIGSERFYLPLFRCKKPAIYIVFNGAPYDPVEKISEKDELPYSIIPFAGTTVVFSDTYRFECGDTINLFIEHFGEGEFIQYLNLKGDRQTYHLKYQIDNLEIEFSSYHRDFKEYSMLFGLILSDI